MSLSPLEALFKTEDGQVSEELRTAVNLLHDRVHRYGTIISQSNSRRAVHLINWGAMQQEIDEAFLAVRYLLSEAEEAGNAIITQTWDDEVSLGEESSFEYEDDRAQ